MISQQRAKVRLNAFLLRHDIRYPGRAPWGPAPRRTIATPVGSRAQAPRRPATQPRSFVRSHDRPPNDLHVLGSTSPPPTLRGIPGGSRAAAVMRQSDSCRAPVTFHRALTAA